MSNKGNKILVSVEHFYPLIGGAEVSLIALLRRLAKKNEIYVFHKAEKNKKFTIDNIKVNSVKLGKLLSKEKYPKEKNQSCSLS